MKRTLIAAGIVVCIGALFVPQFAFADEPVAQESSQAATTEDLAKAETPTGEQTFKPTVLSTESPSKTTAQVSASEVANGVYQISSALKDGANLDVNNCSTKNGAKITLWSANTTVAQRWRLEKLRNGYFKIVNVGSEKVLDVYGAKAKSGTKVIQWVWNGGKNQMWKLTAKDGGYVITSALSDKLVLDAAKAKSSNGTAVLVYSANGAKNQVWKLKEIKRSINDGYYTLTNTGSGKLLDIANASFEDKGNALQYEANGGLNQTFQVRYNNKTGYYSLRNVGSGKALDVYGASTKNGANVSQWSPNATAAQMWAIQKNTDGSYRLVNGKSGRSLDVYGASKKNGANVAQWTSNNTSAQKWKFTKVTNWLPEGVYNIVTGNNHNLALGISKKSMSSGANVQSASRSDLDWSQNWIIMQDANNPGYYIIRNLNSRMVLGVQNATAKSGANIQQAGQTFSNNQLWKPVLSSNGIVFQSKLDASLVLDMENRSTKVGTNVLIWTDNKQINQKFCLKKESINSLLKNSAFFIRNVSSNLMLDVNGASTKDNAAIQLWESNGGKAQKFRFGPNGGGLSILNTNSYKAVANSLKQQASKQVVEQRWNVALDMETATFTITSATNKKRMDGTNGKLSLQVAANTDAQKWILQPTEADYFRVYLNAGHGWNDYNNGLFATGAVGNGYREADLTAELCGLIIKYARDQYGLDVVDGRNYQLAYWKRLPKAVSTNCSTIFSVHFDAGGGSGPMTMVGVSGRHPASMTFANIMSKHLNASLPGLTPRRMSYRDDITCVNGSIPAVLVEVCFVDNYRDISYYQSRKDKVARELAAGLYEASQQKSLRKSY